MMQGFDCDGGLESDMLINPSELNESVSEVKMLFGMECMAIYYLFNQSDSMYACKHVPTAQ